MLIDGSQPEEKRAVIVSSNKKKITQYRYESASDSIDQRGSLFLGTVSRIEPSLRAAFVDYGEKKNGFLPFSQIHPKYYSILYEDQKIIDLIKQEQKKGADKNCESDLNDLGSDYSETDLEAVLRKFSTFNSGDLLKKYASKIIVKDQVVLIQILKSGKGTKGALVSTYISIAGRYCVFMPNTPNSGGISRRILCPKKRTQIQRITQELDIKEGSSVVIRTAALFQKQPGIKRDYQYLTRAWKRIRDKAIKSVAPCLISEDSSFIARYIRDTYNKDIENIYVSGSEAYKEAKSFMKKLVPTNTKKIILYSGPVSIFIKFNAEKYIRNLYKPSIPLKSGGSIVIQHTEALTTIDVNSGKSKEKNIDKSCYCTNLEAIDEAVQQIRNRLISGIIVIDFIEMKNKVHVQEIEKKVRGHFKNDPIKTQISPMSKFGLIELSRQRLYSNVIEKTHSECPHCNALGYIPNVPFASSRAIQLIEEQCSLISNSSHLKEHHVTLIFYANKNICYYIQNEKREQVFSLEKKHDLSININVDEGEGFVRFHKAINSKDKTDERDIKISEFFSMETQR